MTLQAALTLRLNGGKKFKLLDNKIAGMALKKGKHSFLQELGH